MLSTQYLINNNDTCGSPLLFSSCVPPRRTERPAAFAAASRPVALAGPMTLLFSCKR